jgi:hypothetical protein
MTLWQIMELLLLSANSSTTSHDKFHSWQDERHAGRKEKLFAAVERIIQAVEIHSISSTMYEYPSQQNPFSRS